MPISEEEKAAARARSAARHKKINREGGKKSRVTAKERGHRQGPAPDPNLIPPKEPPAPKKAPSLDLSDEAAKAFAEKRKADRIKTPEERENLAKEFIEHQRASLTPDEQKLFDAKQRRNAMAQLAEQKARKAMKKEKEFDAKDAVERELASRILAKRRLLAYVRKFQPGYDAGWVHQDICWRLEKFFQDVVDGKSPRLMLCMPPRHGKSLLASNHFPAWALGHRPDFEIIAASYAVSLPLGFSRKVRSRIRDDKAYQAIFPDTRLSPEAQNAEGWETTKGGGYVPAGVGGGITGKGAHILIIDDPVKDADEADSGTIRDSTWDWWGATAKTRLAPGGGVLVIQTRWHDDDLAGRMLLQQKELLKEAAEMEEEGKHLLTIHTDPDSREHKEALQFIQQAKELREEIDNWELVNYPAIAEHDEYMRKDTHEVVEKPIKNVTRLLRKKGEALHPARFGRPRLMNMKRTMQPRHWSALYQQNPVPDEGLYFTKSDFRFRGQVSYSPRENEVRMLAVDLAITEKQTSDRTSLAVGILGWDRTITVPEIIRGRWGTYQIVDAICNAIQRWDIEIIGLENGQLKHAIMPTLLEEMSARNIVVAFDDELTPITDKAARARTLQGYMQQGRWFYVSNDTWWDHTKQEMLRFPGGVHDDDVDSQAWLARMASKIAPPPRPVQRGVEDGGWRERLRRQQAGSYNGGGHMAA